MKQNKKNNKKTIKETVINMILDSSSNHSTKEVLDVLDIIERIDFETKKCK